MTDTKSARQTWWVAIKNADGSEDEPEVAQVWFNGSAVEEVLRVGNEWGYSSDEVRLIEPVIPAGRALNVESFCRALRESAKSDEFCFGRIQEEEEDEEFNQTGRAFTLIDAWIDLERAAEILNGKEPQA